MHKKAYKIFFIFLLISIFSINNLFCLELVPEIRDIWQTKELGGEILPVSFNINFKVFEFPEDSETPFKMNFALNGGYGIHELQQDPVTGLAPWSDNFIEDADPNGKYALNRKEYGIIFNSWDCEFSQVIPIPEMTTNKLTAWISSTGRFEQAVNKLSYLRQYQAIDPKEDPVIYRLRDSVFVKGGQINPIFTESYAPLLGTPELDGNHLLLSMGINGGLRYEDRKADIPYRISLSGYFSPSWLFNNSSENYGGSSDYYKIQYSVLLNKSLLYYTYSDPITKKTLSLFEIKLKNNFNYRYLKGDKVPLFAQDAFNLRHSITNRLSLLLIGPQIIAADTYPQLEIYYDTGYKWGQLNNTTFESIYPQEYRFNHGFGLYFDFRIMSIFHFSCRATYTIKNEDIQNQFYFKNIYFWVKL